MGNCVQMKPSTYSNASIELSTISKTFKPLPDLQGGNGFPFITNGQFVKVIMKKRRPMHTVRNLSKLYKIESQHILLPKRMVETTHAVVFFYTLCEMDLVDYLNNNETNANQRHQIIMDVAHGLAHLHTNGFVHRDIKLDNVLMKNNKAILCDLDQATPTNVRVKTCGTPNYLPSDYIKDSLFKLCDLKEANIWMDCYAFGKLIAQILYREHHQDLLHLWTRWIYAPKKRMPVVDTSELRSYSIMWCPVLRYCKTNENNIFLKNSFFNTSLVINLFHKLY